MKLTVTLVDSADARRRDHVLDLPPYATVGDLAAAVDRTPSEGPGPRGEAGAAGGAAAFAAGQAAAVAPRALHLGPAPLDPAAPVAGAGVLEGAVLGLGAPVDDLDRVRVPAPDGRPGGAAQLELHLVSAPAPGGAGGSGPAATRSAPTRTAPSACPAPASPPGACG